MLQATCHTHHAENVERHERGEEANDPTSGGAFAQRFMESKAKHFWKPISETSKIAKDDAAYDHVMEVCNEEFAVVHLKVDPWHS